MSVQIWFNHRCRASLAHWLVGDADGKEADARAHVAVIATDVSFHEASEDHKKQGCWIVAKAKSAQYFEDKPSVPPAAVKIRLAGERFVDTRGHTVEGCNRLFLTSDKTGRAVAYALFG